MMFHCARPSLLTPALACLLLAGCAAPVADNQQPQEVFVVVSEQLAATDLQPFGNQFLQYVQNHAVAGSVWHVISAPSWRHAGTFEVPDRRGSARLRHANIKDALPQIRTAFEAGGETQGRINIPMLSTTVANLRRTDFPCVVCLYGTPLYLDPKQGGLMMRPGRVTTDKSIGTAAFPTEISLPKGTKVNWVRRGQPALDLAHGNQAARFNRLYMQALEGQLIRVTGDQTLAFNFKTYVPPLEVTAMPGEPGTRQVSEPSKPSQGNTEITPTVLPIFDKDGEEIRPDAEVASDNEPDRQSVETAARSDPTKIGLFLEWIPLHGSKQRSRPAKIDLDMYVSSAGLEGPIYFGKKQKPWGRLFRDVVASNRFTASATEALTNSEYALINHDRLAELQLYINAFRMEASARVKVTRIWKGESKSFFFSMNPPRETGPESWKHRDTHDAWVKIKWQDFRSQDQDAEGEPALAPAAG